METDIAVTNATGSFIRSCTDYCLDSMLRNGLKYKATLALEKGTSERPQVITSSDIRHFFRPGSDDQISRDTFMPICNALSNPFENEMCSEAHLGIIELNSCLTQRNAVE
jgi:hypothetical protein